MLVALLALLCSALGGVRSVEAAEPPGLMIVFDGSGSMWGKLDADRQSKLVMARDAVRLALGRLPPTTRVGLMSFGHRRGGDCQDTEVIANPAALDVERIMGPLEKLNPRGRGPLTRALREAAAELGAATAPATIVLVHDGLDNCQMDPCAITGELRQSHPALRVHVVSLGLPPDEAQRMACVPQATGGRHFVVASAEETAQALIEVARLVAAPAGALPATASPQPATGARPASPAPAATAVAPPLTVPAGRPGLQLAARLVKGGPPVALPIDWQVRRTGEKGAPLWEGTTAAPLLLLASGSYDITARSGLIVRQATAEAVAGQPRALDIVLDAGTLVLSASQAAHTMLDDAVISLARLEGKGLGEPQILRHPAAEIALPAGNYLMALSSGSLRIERPVGIEAGVQVSIAGSIGLGIVELSTAVAKGGSAVDGVVYAIYEDDPDAPQGRREIARSAAASPRLKLPAGTYFVIARRGAAETRDRITVREGETERRMLVLESGQIALSSRIAGGGLASEGPLAHRLERLDVQPREVWHASGPAATFEVASGRYRLDTRTGLGNVQAEREVRLKAGEVEKVAIEHAAGVVRLRLFAEANGPALPDIGWEVRDRAGKTVWAGLGAEARALLLAGRYTVRAEGRGLNVERQIDVRPGEVRDIDLAVK